MIVVFVGLLIYFVFGSGWYPAMELVIKGIAPEPGTSLVVRWESVEGFNDYERKQFNLNTMWPEGVPEHNLTIRRVGKTVRLIGIRLDNRHDIPLKDLIAETTGIDEGGFLKFKKDGAEIQLDVKAKQNIRFLFFTNNYAGRAEVGVNGKIGKYDLYTHNEEIRRREINYWLIAPDGSFEITMPIPRYKIKTMVIEPTDGATPIHFQSVLLKHQDGHKNFATGSQPAPNIILKDLNGGLKQYWHAGRFIFQCIFALISTWILFALWRLFKKMGSLRDMILNDRRYIFWLFFGGAILSFSIWLIAFWPGVMSIDSLKVWRAASIPGLFIMDHPILNVIFYMYLMHLWNHIAVVPIIHIVLVSLLGSYIFFSLYRKGIRLTVLLPFYLLFVFSIPVGLYNIVLWKDIPFALLVTFWAFTLTDMLHHKKRGSLKISMEKWGVLFLLYLSLALIRYNGALYLLIIPALLVAMRIIPVKKAVIFLTLLSIFGIAAVFATGLRLMSINDRRFLEIASRYTDQIRKTALAPAMKRAVSYYFFILNINQTESNWDLWHYYLNDRYAQNYFLKPAGWNDVYPYLKPNRYPIQWLHDLGLKIYKQTYKTPWVYLSWNPFYMLGLFLVVIVLFWLFPMSAIYSTFVVVQIAALLLIFPLNWRYYYFAVFSSYFLIPMMILDIKNRNIFTKKSISHSTRSS